MEKVLSAARKVCRDKHVDYIIADIVYNDIRIYGVRDSCLPGSV